MSTATTKPDTTTATETDDARLRRLCREIGEINPEALPPVHDGPDRHPTWNAVDRAVEHLKAARATAEADVQSERAKIQQLAEALLERDFSCLPPSSGEVWRPLTRLAAEIKAQMGARRM